MDGMRSTERAAVEQQVVEVVADMSGASVADIDISRWVTDYDVDSLQLVVVRETLESVLRVYLPDAAWLGFESLEDLIDYVANGQAGRAAATASGPPRESSETARAGQRYTDSGLLYGEIEIGMPLTGRNNLAEGPLLQHLGDLRWRHISHLCGVPSRRIVDEDGNRLYPTFFYVEIAFPHGRPLASFGENDRLKAASDLGRFGTSMLDGTFYLLAEDAPETDRLPYASVGDAVADGVPAVRLSNIFVMMFDGAEWLKKSRPAAPRFADIRELPEAPDAYALVKRAEQEGHFRPPPPGYVPMTDGPAVREYRLVPDRDLNGAGLVYFANYPVFLDICERDVLASAELPLPSDLIDRRTLVSRQSAYLNNASADDVLSVEVEAFVENPFATQSAGQDMAPIRMFLNYRMRRLSDGRTMMVSNAEKMIFGHSMQDAPFYGRLRDEHGSPGTSPRQS